MKDIAQLQSLYSQQYPNDIQQQHKSIAKYIKKAFKTDLKDIHKYYLKPARHELFVAVDENNTDSIIGMIGIRENKSWNVRKIIQKKVVNDDKMEIKTEADIEGDRKPNFKFAHQCIDDVIDILQSMDKNEQKIDDQQLQNIEAEIMRFGVAGNYRRKGIGTALMDHAKNFCMENEYKIIVASTMNVLEDAVSFYKSSGFKLEETEPCGYNTKLSFLRFKYDLN